MYSVDTYSQITQTLLAGRLLNNPLDNKIFDVTSEVASFILYDLGV